MATCLTVLRVLHAEDCSVDRQDNDCCLFALSAGPVRLTSFLLHVHCYWPLILSRQEFGDGIMSAIGFYCTVERMTGTEGEPRVVITFNGKFLPYVEQKVADNVAITQRSSHQATK